MKISDPKKKVIDYVLARRCPSGGFCFYKLDEPNGSDSYFALSILNLLDVPYHDDQTMAYLRDMQHEDGFYDSIFSAFYSIKGLQLLKEKPGSDPAPYVLQHLRHYSLDVRKLPPEIHSVFKRLLYMVDLYRSLGVERDEALEADIVDFILSFQNGDGGLGNPSSNLTDTARALVMLEMLGYPVKELGAEHFIRQCETPLFGFTDMPHRSLSYMEYVYAGVLASSIISYKPCYRNRCVDFILDCQTTNGGFSRAPHTGIATMENTCLAIRGLTLLHNFEKRL